MKKTLKIATRKSPMALYQAKFVQDQLEKFHPNLTCELVEFQTDGDRFLDKPLTNIGGKALFVKALEQGLYQGEADIAVHCVKDMPCELPEGLVMAAVLKRDNPCDAFVSNDYASLEVLPIQSVVGTSSPRRASQLLRLRPDIHIKPLRGNVLSRLEKLDEKEFDAILLAVAGLERLSIAHRIAQRLDPYVFVPAIGQGALCVECLASRTDLLTYLRPLHDKATAVAIIAERRVNQILQGGCHAALGAHAVLSGQDLHLSAMVLSQDGVETIYAQGIDDQSQAQQLGEKIADDLLRQGARALLE